MSLLIIGISISMILFLLASGLTLIFGILRMVNFAHGAIYMFGAYVGYQVFQWTGSFWFSLVLAPLIVGILGAGIEFFLMRPIYKFNIHAYELMIQIGVIYVLIDLARFFWGDDFLHFLKPESLKEAVEIAGLSLDPYRLFIIGLSVAIGFVMFWGLEKTNLGIAVRATSSNPSMAECLGINVAVLRTSVFGFGSALAALGGVVAAAIYPIDSLMGNHILIDCFIVVVLGGLGNVHGAVIGALIIGMTRAFGQYYLAESVNVLTYCIFIATLLFLPEGIFYRKGRKA